MSIESSDSRDGREDHDENVEPGESSGGTDFEVHGDEEPPRAEEVVEDEDLTLPGSLESIEGSPASPDPEDPGDPSPDRKP